MEQKKLLDKLTFTMQKTFDDIIDNHNHAVYEESDQVIFDTDLHEFMKDEFGYDYQDDDMAVSFYENYGCDVRADYEREFLDWLEMEILEIKLECTGCADLENDIYALVTAKAGDITKTFQIQFVDNVYRSELGCLFTNENGDCVCEEDYPNFDFEKIIDVAEREAQEDFKNSYIEKEIDFNCSIDSSSVFMRIEKDTEQVQLVIKNIGNIRDYQKEYEETSRFFDNEKEALEYTSTFRNDNEYQDCRGLNALMKDLRNN